MDNVFTYKMKYRVGADIYYWCQTTIRPTFNLDYKLGVTNLDYKLGVTNLDYYSI